MPLKRMEYFRLLFDHLAWIEHQFLSGIRGSRKAGILWGIMRGVGGVRKSIDQSWLDKGLGLGLLCWGFKGIQEEIPSEEIPSEEASTLQIGSVAFPPGQYTSPQLHPCHRLANQFWCIDLLTPPTLLIFPHRLPTFFGSLMPLKNWYSIHARWSKSSLKHSIRFCGTFSKFKTEFYCISFF